MLTKEEGDRVSKEIEKGSHAVEEGDAYIAVWKVEEILARFTEEDDCPKTD